LPPTRIRLGWCSVKRGVRADNKEVELTVAPKLLGELDLRGRIVTFDALHTQAKTARQVLRQGGDYFMVVKENRKALFDEIKLLFDEPPVDETGVEQFGRSLTKGWRGDRYEERELVCSGSLAGYLRFPKVGQVARIERRVSRKGETKVELAYAVTSLSPKRADPTMLQALWRGHWRIENKLHYVRDVTFGEDLSQVRLGSAPQVMAALRNVVLGLLHLAGVENIAARLRRNARHPHEALATMGWLALPIT
jgi:predicted transposase YbfD/YdcC